MKRLHDRDQEHGPVTPHPLTGRPSNNPAGRIPGSGRVGQLRAQIVEHREFVSAHVPAILRRVLEAALDGDLQAAKLVLDRVFPALKAESAPVLVPGLSGSLMEQGKAIVRHAADGAIPADTAAELVRAIGSLVAIQDGDELKRRLDELEHGDLA